MLAPVLAGVAVLLALTITGAVVVWRRRRQHRNQQANMSTSSEDKMPPAFEIRSVESVADRVPLSAIRFPPPPPSGPAFLPHVPDHDVELALPVWRPPVTYTEDDFD